MSHFYGTLEGSRGKATRCGTKSSGMVSEAAGWKGVIRVYLEEVDGHDRYQVYLEPWQNSGGVSTMLASGTLEAYRASPNVESDNV